MIKISVYPFPKNLLAIKILLSVIGAFWLSGRTQTLYANNDLKLNNLDYFETCGLNVFVFCNWYDVNFFIDSKLSGIEIIYHRVRTATNGDVQLNLTPEQWDPIPEFVRQIEALLAYPDYEFNYTIKAAARNGGILLSVNLDKSLPKELIGRAGFNLEFLSAAYFGKTYLMDGSSGIFLLYPGGPMTVEKSGAIEPKPIATGRWAGSGWVILFANTNYILHKALPEIIGPEYTFRGLNYLYGCHPGSDISLVSAASTYSKKIAYGNNRDDFSFITDGIVLVSL